MRARIFILAAIVAAALLLNLARLSLSIGQTGEDTLRARIAMATAGLRAQLDLTDARLSPRAVASAPDLVEAMRAESGTAGRPDERALRAAAGAISPEPDLIAVASAQGAILSRRAHPAETLDDAKALPLARAAIEANPPPAFASFQGALYRVAAARVPGSAASVVLGTSIDDRFAALLKSQLDADVTLLQSGKVVASSIAASDERPRVARWAAAPAPGYGTLKVPLPVVGTALSGKLPRGAARYAVRGALVQLDSGVQAAVTVPASPYFVWLGRYQALYLFALAVFVLFSLVWGLSAPRSAAKKAQPQPEPAPPPPEEEVSAPRVVSRGTRDVPWSPGEGPSGEHELVAPPITPPPAPPLDALDPDLAEPDGVVGPVKRAEPVLPPELWSADPFAPPQQNEPQVAAQEAELLSSEEGSPGGWGAPAAPTEEPGPGMAPAEGGQGQESEQPEAHGAAQADASEPLAAETAPSEPTAPLIAAAEAPPPAPPEANVTMQDFSMPALEEQDPDETHWRETYDKFKELRARLGEPADRITFEKFAAKLRKNRADLIARHNCKGVRFSVYEKDGKASIKASAIR